MIPFLLGAEIDLAGAIDLGDDLLECHTCLVGASEFLQQQAVTHRWFDISGVADEAFIGREGIVDPTEFFLGAGIEQMSGFRLEAGVKFLDLVECRQGSFALAIKESSFGETEQGVGVVFMRAGQTALQQGSGFAEAFSFGQLCCHAGQGRDGFDLAQVVGRLTIVTFRVDQLCHVGDDQLGLFAVAQFRQDHSEKIDCRSDTRHSDQQEKPPVRLVIAHRMETANDGNQEG